MKRLIIELLFAALLSLLFVSALEDFSISPPIIKAVIKEGGSINYPVNIDNLKQKQKFEIYHFSRVDFISFDKDYLIVDEGGIGSFNVLLESNYEPGVYVGNIIVSGESGAIVGNAVSGESSTLRIPAILEVESKNVLFDVKTRIAPRNFEINPGEELILDIDVWNIGASEKNVDLEYYISRINGDVIVSDKESLDIDDSLSIRKSFSIPKDAEVDDYVFYVYAKQGSSLGTSSLLFYIGEFVSLSPEFNFVFNDYLYFIGSVLIVLLIGIFLFSYFSNRKLLQAVEWKSRISDIKKMEFGNVNLTIARLIHQKELLEEAFEKGYIKEESYKEGMVKVSQMIRGLKRKLL